MTSYSIMRAPIRERSTCMVMNSFHFVNYGQYLCPSSTDFAVMVQDLGYELSEIAMGGGYIFQEGKPLQIDHIIVPHNRHFSTGVLITGAISVCFLLLLQSGGISNNFRRLMFQRQGALANSEILRRP